MDEIRDSDRDDHQSSADMRRMIFEPLILPLEGTMAIYRGGLDRLCRLHDVKATDRGFSAVAEAIAPIHSMIPDCVHDFTQWRLSGAWQDMWSTGATGRHLVVPYCFSLYIDRALVERVAELLTKTPTPHQTIRRLIKRYDGLVPGRCPEPEPRWPRKAMLRGAR